MPGPGEAALGDTAPVLKESVDQQGQRCGNVVLIPLVGVIREVQSAARRKWQPTPVFLPAESQGWGSLVGCRLWGRTESDTTEVT